MIIYIMNCGAWIAEQNYPLVLIRREVVYFRKGKMATTGCPTEVGSSGTLKLKRTNNNKGENEEGVAKTTPFSFEPLEN